MPWKVKSTVVGGVKLATATSHAYTGFARKLYCIAQELASLSSSWHHAAMVIASQSTALQSAANNTVGKYPSSVFTAHAARSKLTPSLCTHYAQQCSHLSHVVEDLASLIIRANNLYANAEAAARERFDQQVALVTLLAPWIATPIIGGAVIAGANDARQHTGLKHVAKWSHATAPLQQGVIRGLSQHIMLNPITGLPIFLAGSAQGTHGKIAPNLKGTVKNNPIAQAKQYAKRYVTSPVPTVAGALSLVTAKINNLMQGDTLHLTKIEQFSRNPQFVLTKKGATLGEALDNLTELADGNFGVHPPRVNPDAATIAVQRFKRANGTTSWLVTIPGTDGKPHSPFGWEQNLEAMSNAASMRKQADSTRMVVEAMRRSGIKPHDPVVLVGHSQGGIVAASIASDYSKQYNIKHVVTAGSPIANHPIPKRTWVTSIEMEDELVPTLDGKNNPMRKNWITIHGRATQVRGAQRMSPSGVARFIGGPRVKRKFDENGVLVEDVPEEGTLTHDLHYHKAAYEDASQLGSAAIRSQEQHFQNTIRGELQSTFVWQGVMR